MEKFPFVFKRSFIIEAMGRYAWLVFPPFTISNAQAHSLACRPIRFLIFVLVFSGATGDVMPTSEEQNTCTLHGSVASIASWMQID